MFILHSTHYIAFQDFKIFTLSWHFISRDQKREKGNTFYSRGEYSSAINTYTK